MGAAFLALQVWPLILLEVALNRKGNNIVGIIFIILIMVIYSTLLNNFLITPAYNGWDAYYSDLWASLKIYFPVALTFNILKMTVVYSISVALMPLLNKETYNA